MWDWLWKLLGLKSKQLQKPVEDFPQLNYVETPPVNTDGLPIYKMKPNLFQALAKARQEALEPVLPDSMKPAVDAGVDIVLPAIFKKHLMSKEDLILFGKSDIITHLADQRISDDDWNTIKCFIIKRLNDEGIKAEASSSGSFVMCHCEQILKAIKDTQVLIEVEDKDLPEMNSVGIYR